MITYRVMNASDVPAGLSLCRAAGWNQSHREWELFLQSDPKGCFVATADDNKVVGTVTTIQYDDHFSWVGMVLVDPAIRRQGIGSGLLHKALHSLSEQSTIKLDATPEGREVYLKLGFKDEYDMTRMHLHKVDRDQVQSSTSARLFTNDDLDEVLKLDAEVFGANRSRVLTWLRDGAPELAFIIRDNTGLSGYCFGRHGHNFSQIGPIVSNDIDSALQLVTAAAMNLRDHEIILDVLHHTPAWEVAVKDLGFVERRRLIRMYKGSNAWPGDINRQFAIAGPELG